MTCRCSEGLTPASVPSKVSLMTGQPITSDPVLVTGASGYIGLFVVKQLLDKGYTVRGTVRDLEREASLRKTLEEAGCDTSRLEFVAADLRNDTGWNGAVERCRFVLHVASPVPRTVPKPEDELSAPARDGTMRVLKAASTAGVQRVVLTSSISAVLSGRTRDTTNRWARKRSIPHDVQAVHRFGVGRAVDPENICCWLACEWNHVRQIARVRDWLREALASEGLDRSIPLFGLDDLTERRGRCPHPRCLTSRTRQQDNRWPVRTHGPWDNPRRRPFPARSFTANSAGVTGKLRAEAATSCAATTRLAGKWGTRLGWSPGLQGWF